MRLAEPAAVVFGEASDAVVAQLGEYGATKVCAETRPRWATTCRCPRPRPSSRSPAPPTWSRSLHFSGPEGKDIAARVAVRLNSGIVPDATVVALDGGNVVATQTVFAGRWQARSQIVRGPAVITMRPNATSAEAPLRRPRQSRPSTSP